MVVPPLPRLCWELAFGGKLGSVARGDVGKVWAGALCCLLEVLKGSDLPTELLIFLKLEVT